MQYKLIVEKGWSAGRLDRIESWGSAFAILFWGIHQVLKLIQFHCKQEKLNMFWFEGAITALWDPLPFVTVCHILVRTFESHEKNRAAWRKMHDMMVSWRQLQPIFPKKKQANNKQNGSTFFFAGVSIQVHIFNIGDVHNFASKWSIFLLENIFLVVFPYKQRYSKIFLILFSLCTWGLTIPVPN